MEIMYLYFNKNILCVHCKRLIEKSVRKCGCQWGCDIPLVIDSECIKDLNVGSKVNMCRHAQSIYLFLLDIVLLCACISSDV